MQKGKIIYLKPRWLAGFHSVGPYGETVPAAWDRVLEYLDSGMHFEMPDRGYGLTYDDPRSVAAERLRYVAGVNVASDWLPHRDCAAMRIEFKGGSYSVFRHEGSFKEVGEVISKVRTMWVPRLGLRLDPAKPLLAIYHGDPRTVPPAQQVAEICLPVTMAD